MGTCIRKAKRTKGKRALPPAYFNLITAPGYKKLREQRETDIYLTSFSPCSLSKKLPTHKPDSVSKLSFIWPCHYWQDLAAYPPTSGKQPSNAGIRGITACKVYPSPSLLIRIVGSYPTFSPSSRSFRIGTVIFCGTFCSRSCGSGPGA